MMEISGQGMAALGDIFRNTRSFNYDYYTTSGYNYLTADNTSDSGLPYSKCFSIDLTKDTIEYPVMCKTLIEDIASKNLEFIDYIRFKADQDSESLLKTNKPPREGFTERVVYTIFDNTGSYAIKRTFNTIIKELFTHTGTSQKLEKVKLPTGDYFYGAPGIILDKDFDPLLLCTLVAHIKKGHNLYWEYDRPNCYISPKVLMDRKKNLVYKGIVDRVIPYYSNYKIYLNYRYQRFYPRSLDKSKGSLVTVRIIVDDIQPFIHRPILPTPDKTSQEELNQYILNHIEDFKCMFKE